VNEEKLEERGEESLQRGERMISTIPGKPLNPLLRRKKTEKFPREGKGKGVVKRKQEKKGKMREDFREGGGGAIVLMLLEGG